MYPEMSLTQLGDLVKAIDQVMKDSDAETRYEVRRNSIKITFRGWTRQQEVQYYLGVTEVKIEKNNLVLVIEPNFKTDKDI